MIPVAKLREMLAEIAHGPNVKRPVSASMEILGWLPRDGVILSGDEVAQIRRALRVTDRCCVCVEHAHSNGAALALLEEQEKDNYRPNVAPIRKEAVQ